MSDLQAGVSEPSAAELRRRFQVGDDTPSDALERCLARIDEADGDLNAFLATDREAARAEADRATKAYRQSQLALPPLLGVPVSVKDTVEVAGMPTTYGSALFADNQRPDSLLAQRLRAQGAVIVGKTNTPEFALVTDVRNRLGGPTRNPLDPSRTAGGSSGGAAAALAAGMCAVSVGTDSAGSIRVPAAYTGLVGLKPTYQRIPWVQDWKASLTRSHSGPISRDAQDAWDLLVALSGYDYRDPSSRLPALDPSDLDRARMAVAQPLNVAILLDETGPFNDDVVLGEEVREVLTDLVGKPTQLSFADLVEPFETSAIWTYAAEHYAAAEKLRGDLWTIAPDLLTDYARPIYTAAREQIAYDYVRQSQAQRQAGIEFAHELDAYDYVFTTVAGEAPVIEEPYVPIAFPRLGLINIAGLPAASVPFGTYPSGLPKAIQIIGRFGDDAGVLALAERLLQTTSSR